MQQSAAGDLILLLVAFDGAVILQSNDFVAFSHSLKDAGDLRALYLLLIVITLTLWAIAVFGLERRMQFGYGEGRSALLFRASSMVGYIGLAAVAFVLNTAAFTVRL